MDKTMRINAIIRHIETHIKEATDYRSLELAVGLSYRQLREDFQSYAKQPLKRYILSRKISYAAFEIETTSKSLLTISTEYGFEVYDTFTRVFRREVGIPPASTAGAAAAGSGTS